MAVLLCAALVLQVRAGDAAPSAAARQFELLKSLTGDWVTLGEDGQPTETIASSFRVTSAGSAIVETIFPGSDHEMVTVYHLDGDELILTHYCTLGNQPRLRAIPGADEKKITFKFLDATNLKNPRDQHMHDAEFTIVSPDRYQAVWTSQDGESCPESKMVFVRKNY
jgi:hypothetical protein